MSNLTTVALASSSSLSNIQQYTLTRDTPFYIATISQKHFGDILKIPLQHPWYLMTSNMFKVKSKCKVVTARFTRA